MALAASALYSWAALLKEAVSVKLYGGGEGGGGKGEGHTSIWRATPANENQRPLVKALLLVFFTESVTCAQRREGGFDLARGGLGAPGAAHGQRGGRWCGL